MNPHMRDINTPCGRKGCFLKKKKVLYTCQLSLFKPDSLIYIYDEYTPARGYVNIPNLVYKSLDVGEGRVRSRVR